MGKAVLISIRPKWCDLIANGKKTVEIRKTRPKLETPFKCYIYQTLPKSGDWNKRDGRVVGEFVCGEIKKIHVIDRGNERPKALASEDMVWSNGDVQRMSCLSTDEICDYIGEKGGYGWLVSDLWMYDEPKQLSEFTPCCKFMLDEKQCDYRKVKFLNQQESFMEEDGCNCLNFVRRPPQSYFYVEEM